MKRSFKMSIKSKILSRVLPIATIPLIVLGALAVISLSSLSSTTSDSLGESRVELQDTVVSDRLQDQSDQIARELNTFVQERVVDVRTWARTPTVTDAARDGAQKAAEAGLTDFDLSDEAQLSEVEAQFEDSKRIEGNDAAENYLEQQLQLAPQVAEVFFTESNGFNVGLTSPTSDFVQSDEDWWTGAWADGLHLSEVEFDDSSGVFSVDVSVRIDDPITSRPLGVMKAALSVGIVQELADGFGGGDSPFQVTVFTNDGLILAETATDHSAERIMNPEFNVANEGVNALASQVSSAPERSGVLNNDQFVAGFSHVADSELNSGLTTLLDAENLQSLEWVVLVEQDIATAFQPLDGLAAVSDDVQSSRNQLTGMFIALILLAVLAAVVTAVVLARRIVQPVERLRDAAERSASQDLPQLIESVKSIGDDEELPELENIEIASGDEVEELASSFNTMQATAARLAGEQVRLRRQNVSTTFISLGRRNQNLLSKQLEFIDQLERQETNPDTLQDLFRLDHLATRMRRNAESLLVLAGQETPRRWTRPVSIREVIQASAGEIEDFQRVAIEELEDAAVEGGVASDITHLVAELIENSAAFSPPTADIRIVGRRVDDNYVLSIVDQGIGMTAEAIAEANGRLEDPVEFDEAPSAYLGLFVVGHLARKQGISVRLIEGAVSGITAKIEIPASVLVEAPAQATPAAPASTQQSAADSATKPAAENAAPETSSNGAPETDRLSENPGGSPTDETPIRHNGPSESMPELGNAPDSLAGEDFPDDPDTPSAPPVQPAPATTQSGFKVRNPGTHSAIAPPAVAPTTQQQPPATSDEEQPPRTAQTVRASLAAFRDGSGRGKADLETNHDPIPSSDGSDEGAAQ